jgi:hypothetical protein
VRQEHAAVLDRRLPQRARGRRRVVGGAVIALAHCVTEESEADLAGAGESYESRLDTHVRVVRPALVAFRATEIFAPLFAPEHISSYGAAPAADGAHVFAAVVPGRFVISAALERCRHA